jgi:RimJ/RimL family protein N-acetyltransferase
MIVIRAARPEDASVLVEAEREAAAEPGLLTARPHELRVEHLERRIVELVEHPRGRYIVATHDTDIVGHAFLDPRRLQATGHVVTLSVVVHTKWRGRGVGTRMMEDLTAWARRTHGIDKIELRVRAGNEPAIDLYQRFGFVEEGRLKGRIKISSGRYLDDVAMALWTGDRRGL